MSTPILAGRGCAAPLSSLLQLQGHRCLLATAAPPLDGCETLTRGLLHPNLHPLTPTGDDEAFKWLFLKQSFYLLPINSVHFNKGGLMKTWQPSPRFFFLSFLHPGKMDPRYARKRVSLLRANVRTPQSSHMSSTCLPAIVPPYKHTVLFCFVFFE